MEISKDEAKLVLEALESLIYEHELYMGDGLMDDALRVARIEAAQTLGARLRGELGES